MKNHLLSGVSAFIIIAILFAAECLFESKGFEIYIGGTIVMGGTIAVGAFSISVIANWLKSVVQVQILIFLLPAFLFGALLGVGNLWTLSDSMTITGAVALYQIALFVAVGLATGGVSYLCTKLNT